jgi:hypothetical protein
MQRFHVENTLDTCTGSCPSAIGWYLLVHEDEESGLSFPPAPVWPLSAEDRADRTEPERASLLAVNSSAINHFGTKIVLRNHPALWTSTRSRHTGINVFFHGKQRGVALRLTLSKKPSRRYSSRCTTTTGEFFAGCPRTERSKRRDSRSVTLSKGGIRLPRSI